MVCVPLSAVVSVATWIVLIFNEDTNAVVTLQQIWQKMNTLSLIENMKVDWPQMQTIG